VEIYVVENNASHGFLRASDGKVTTFDASGAGTGANQRTFACSNNVEGATVRFCINSSNVSHGFVRMP